ncbi:MAG: ABC transporter permease [Calditrichia bacterium]
MQFLRQLMESFKIALSAIRANKSRGVLTTLGIVIGILAVVTTMTAANGLQNSFKESISALGTDVLYVTRMPWVIMDNYFEYRNRPQLTFEQCEKLQQQLTSARAVNPSTSTRRNIKFRSEVLEGILIIGTTENQVRVSSGLPESGRFLNALDVQNKRRVCVIGKEIAEKLFPNLDPINKKINLGRHKFRIVGVMEKQGSAGFFGGPNFDAQIFIPITTFMKVYGGRQRNFTIAVKAPEGVSLEEYQYEIIGTMRKIRKLGPMEKDDFSINTMDTLVSAYNSVMGVVVLIGLVITSISLFVGGIGVMNIMFVSVTERTREIGIRKAIGATRKLILTQFLFESSVICLLGGLIGLGLSYGIAALINKMLLPAQVSPAIVTVAILVSLLVGISSGIIPAFRAARLNPIEALRYE